MDRPSLNEPYLPRPDDSLASLLQRYRSQRVGRAGGVYALTGFDFQLRTYLADYVMELANPEKLAVAGAEFSSALESFSDYTRRSAADVVCVQVKTTLGRRELRTALREFVDIAEFLREESSWIPKFEIVAQHIETNIDLVKLCAGDMSAVEALSADERATEILVTGRLLAIRLEPDPWWRLISACYGQLDDPFAFARWALDKCMGIDSSPGTAAEIRDSIAEEFVRRRKQTDFPGSVITEADVMIDAAGRDDIVVGSTPTLRHLRSGTFMARPSHIVPVIRALEGFIRDHAADSGAPELTIFWIDGRSGCGKSVLLLELMQAVVQSGSNSVIWFGHSAEDVRQFIVNWAGTAESNSPSPLLFVDDLYDPQARDAFDLTSLLSTVAHSARTNWPTVVTCGPPEFRQLFEHESSGEAVAVYSWTLQPLDPEELEELRIWFANRTGRPVAGGPALRQKGALMVSVMAELRYGTTLEPFARRFARRLSAAALAETLVVPLALNRLYIWPPATWLDTTTIRKLRVLTSSGDYPPLQLDNADTTRVRLTHPHISDAIYRQLRAAAQPEDLADDLITAFKRSLESDPVIAVRILASCEVWRGRITAVAENYLVAGLASAWVECASMVSEARASLRAELWASWAVWGGRESSVETRLGIAAGPEALAAAAEDPSVWPRIWSKLWSATDAPAKYLVEQAVEWLTRNPDNRSWPRIWCKLAESSLTWSGQASADATEPDLMAQIGLTGLDWIENNPLLPNWSVVWSTLLAHMVQLRLSEREEQIVRLGISRLQEDCEFAFWSRTWVALNRAMLGTRFEPRVQRLANEWLENYVESPSWPFVWLELARSTRSERERARLSLIAENWMTSNLDAEHWDLVWDFAKWTAQSRDTHARLMDLGHRWIAQESEVRRRGLPLATMYLDVSRSTKQTLTAAQFDSIISVVDSQIGVSGVPSLLFLRLLGIRSGATFTVEQREVILTKARLWLTSRVGSPRYFEYWPDLVTALIGESDTEFLEILQNGASIFSSKTAINTTVFRKVVQTLSNAYADLEWQGIAMTSEQFAMKRAVDEWLWGVGQANQSDWLQMFRAQYTGAHLSTAWRDLAVKYLFMHQLTCPGLTEEMVARQVKAYYPQRRSSSWASLL